MCSARRSARSAGPVGPPHLATREGPLGARRALATTNPARRAAPAGSRVGRRRGRYRPRLIGRYREVPARGAEALEAPEPGSPGSELRYEAFADGVPIGSLTDRGQPSGPWGVLQLTKAGPNTITVK